MISLFFPYYNCKDVERQKEIDYCLRHNINNNNITKIFVISDDGSFLPIESTKVEIIRQSSRPTYRDWIKLTKLKVSSGVSVLCNSDIYFDDSISLIQDIIKRKNDFLALSRWERIDGKISLHENPHLSQDVWALAADADIEEGLLRQLDFCLGVPRCDNKIAYLFGVYGWKVYNPCKEVRSIQFHETELRTYSKKLDLRILGGVSYVNPSKSLKEASVLDIDVWVANSDYFRKVKINKTMEKWIKESKESGLPSLAKNKNINKFPVKMAKQLINNGILKYSYESRIFIYINDDAFISHNRLEPLRFVEFSGRFKLEEMLAFSIPPVLTTYVRKINEKATCADDLNFWQYPCATEKQAYKNHLNMKFNENIDFVEKIISIYIPLPWATYIDKKTFPVEYLNENAKLITFYKQIALKANYSLRVHTVCQHIYWDRIIEVAESIGITDVHISHKTSKSKSKLIGSVLKIHGWPLIAVNFEVHERSDGMSVLPMKDRNVVASFVGAYMKHYIDDTRIRLAELAKQIGRDDFIVDLGNEWHFNKYVYQEQVLHQKLADDIRLEHNQKTFNYNRLLSNSKFALCPVGAGVNTLRLWEAISIGVIPVLFDSDLSILHVRINSVALIDLCVVWEREIDNELISYLDNFDPTELQRRSDKLREIYLHFKNYVFKTNLN